MRVSLPPEGWGVQGEGQPLTSEVTRSKSVTFGLAGVVLAGIWAVLRSGTGIVPGAEWHFAAVLVWPARPESPDEWYLADSPLGIVVGKALRVESLQAFLWLSSFAAGLALAALATWAIVAAKGTDPWRAARLVLLAPIGAILLAWIGMYDAFTVLAWAVALFAWLAGRPVIMATAGLLLGFQHFEHALLGLASLFLVWQGLRERLPIALQKRSPLWFFPGIAMGKCALVLVFWIQGVSTSGRRGWVSQFLYEWTTVGLNVLPLLLWSLFAGWWAVVIFLGLDSTRRQQLYLLSSLAIGIAATIVSGDRPRVFVLVLLPAVTVAAIAFVGSVRRRSREGYTIEAIVWLAPPVLFWGKDVANANVIDLGVTAVRNLIGF